MASSSDASQIGTAGTNTTAPAPTPSPPTTTTNPGTVDEACQAMCDRLGQITCMRANCVSDCQNALILPSCATTYVTFLTCALGVQFTCANGVADLGGACNFQKNDFLICRTAPPATTSPTFPDATAPPPASMDDGGGPRGDSGLDDAISDARDASSDVSDASLDASDANADANGVSADASEASASVNDAGSDAGDTGLDCCF